MDNLQGFAAVVLAALCVIFTVLAAGDLQYMKSQRHPVLFVMICVFLVGSTGAGSYYLW